uniref:Carboxymuconolactone decarboxylase-like domain-containing protein n=1 Tax=Chromera velia CCMP2878 TaxID=1169474 RepID=A0A0G4I368_9ALVE|mmetsp:Transcript_17650/g.35814  ORF Transcript_17650/g.35814 Transcript_17650/m.35814 type:complete len:189 (+) Transcript_17650:432-998(+)|eukprot:Cvel_10547.t1-p1 / transcript=Cvel_10547.t1 / gene=Cvel_10547 / organism=Chromera_velia_CCMP2878 / gene_product=hypothetical protein / transcript_product=hypothetical protein / location=Cvel_scaffold638:65989-66552(-) / protein_length=188 / sequence_SO=supercontig / SO=protein_coding / is_pseudo=false
MDGSSKRVPGADVASVSDQSLASSIRELSETIKERRGGALLHLDKVLLHSPKVARGWNGLFGALRSCSFSPLVQESVILFVAVLNDAPYEWQQHKGPFKNAGGTDEMMQALRKRDIGNCEVFSDLQRAALQLTLEMTENVKVKDETFERVQDLLGGNLQQVVELITLVAGYNCVSRVLAATQMNLESD